ncbi:MAG: hypothetical protein ACO1SV_12485 [Fimbriimonas sp.]
MNLPQPDIQIISNIVVTDQSGQILFVKRDPEDERWWLTGGDVEPYQHPDDCAKKILDALPWLSWQGIRMVNVQSFRGRRGWHVMFNYRAFGRGTPDSPQASWFPQDRFPRTMHGPREVENILDILAKDGRTSELEAR